MTGRMDMERGRRRRGTAALMMLLSVLAVLAGTVGPVEATGTDRTGGNHDRLRIQIDKAPVTPDGTTVGAVTDIVIGFRPIDPDVPGIGLRAGGTLSVRLPPQLVDTGTLPFADFATPSRAPPLVEGCNTALVLQGWPQSPKPPFPSVSWDPATSTITATMAADWLPDGPDAPGPKQLHLLLLGFRTRTGPGAIPSRSRSDRTPPTTGSCEAPASCASSDGTGRASR